MPLEANVQAGKGASRPVWDLPVRLVHWALVGAVAGSWYTAKHSEALFRWHEYLGYTVWVLVVFRLGWGLVGTRHARFGQFLRPPGEVYAYLAGLRSGSVTTPSVGHNPLGGWSVVLLLALLFGQACTGLFANDDVSHVGPLFGWVDSSLSNRLTRLHHRLFTVLEVLIALHVAAIAGYARFRRQDLLTPMFTGRKPAALVPDGEAIGGVRWWLAALLLLGAALALASAIRLAPEASLSIF